MVAVEFHDKERIYFHLGYGAARLGSNGVSQGGIDAADLAQVEEACDNITSQYMLGQVLDQLDILDQTYEVIKLVRASTGRFSVKEIIIGDTNRTINREEVRDIRTWQQEYLNQCDELSRMLAVTNYRHPNTDRYRFSRSGADYIKGVAGPADTARWAKLEEYHALAGSFGF